MGLRKLRNLKVAATKSLNLACYMFQYFTLLLEILQLPIQVIFVLITDAHCFSMYVIQKPGISESPRFMYKKVRQEEKVNIQ
jgi:hypothetical protein